MEFSSDWARRFLHLVSNRATDYLFGDPWCRKFLQWRCHDLYIFFQISWPILWLEVRLQRSIPRQRAISFFPNFIPSLPYTFDEIKCNGKRPNWSFVCRVAPPSVPCPAESGAWTNQKIVFVACVFLSYIFSCSNQQFRNEYCVVSNLSSSAWIFVGSMGSHPVFQPMGGSITFGSGWLISFLVLG